MQPPSPPRGGQQLHPRPQQNDSPSTPLAYLQPGVTLSDAAVQHGWQASQPSPTGSYPFLEPSYHRPQGQQWGSPPHDSYSFPSQYQDNALKMEYTESLRPYLTAPQTGQPFGHRPKAGSPTEVEVLPNSTSFHGAGLLTTVSQTIHSMTTIYQSQQPQTAPLVSPSSLPSPSGLVGYPGRFSFQPAPSQWHPQSLSVINQLPHPTPQPFAPLAPMASPIEEYSPTHPEMFDYVPAIHPPVTHMSQSNPYLYQPPPWSAPGNTAPTFASTSNSPATSTSASPQPHPSPMLPPPPQRQTRLGSLPLQTTSNDPHFAQRVRSRTGYSTHSTSSASPPSSSTAPSPATSHQSLSRRPSVPVMPTPSSSAGSVAGFSSLAVGERFPPAAFVASANRQKLGAVPVGAWNRRPTPRRTNTSENQGAQTDKIDRRRGVKVVVERRADCVKCGKSLAVLQCRGLQHEVDTPVEGGYWCSTCVSIPDRKEGDEDSTTSEEEEDFSYKDTLSADVDRLQGIEVMEEEPDVVPPPSRERSSLMLGKKRRAEEEIMICDVCTREIGTGGFSILGSGGTQSAPFGVEVICNRCYDRYQRCSDCGGSGGPRLGVGKWRCKELFPGGRKTCLLSHLRMGPLTDMSYDIWAIRDLPADELEEFIVAARDLYQQNLVAGLATPDMLEPGTALARNFEEVQKMAVDSWTMVEPLLREDIEDERGTRRYVGIRWSTPPPRKKKGGDDVKEEEPEHDLTKLIRNGKTLASFVLAELDLPLGSLCINIQTPWNTGETFNATTVLMQNLLRRLDFDIVELNSLRDAVSPPLPHLSRVKQAWIMMFFKKDSRLYRDLISRRGFYDIDEYIAKFGGDVTHFAPHRPIWLPIQYQKGWKFLVRPVQENDEWGGREVETKRRRKGKRKA
ncbi:hypothetical protein T439DRAFT_329300 [Meredithblackwellia eburnea MCA 4105]